MRSGLTTILAAVFVTAAVYSARAAEGDPLIPVDAVGRLFLDRGMCTAFPVLSLEQQPPEGREIEASLFGRRDFVVWLATAAHCVERSAVGDLWYEQPPVIVRNTSGENAFPRQRVRISRIIGFSSPEHGWDVALLAYRSTYPVPVLEPAFGKTPVSGEVVLNPAYGGRAFMIRANRFLGVDPSGLLLIDGVASPGSSGSPILFAGTRQVVGVVVMSTIDGGPRSSIVCLLRACHRTSPYIAVPIDRILGLVRWPGHQ